MQGGEKTWNGMSATAQANFADITHALEKVALGDGVTGLSEIKPGSASMRSTGREMDVTWKSGAEKAFESAGFHDTHNPLHSGLSLKPPGWNVKNLHLVLPQSPERSESQVHIDYRGALGGHWGPHNDDVTYNKEQYKSWYGPLPGLIP